MELKRLRALLLSLFTSLTLVALLLLVTMQTEATLIGAGDSATAASPEESGLNANGSAFEINIGPDGYLLISDYDAGEIWQVNPATAAYTLYQNIQSPSDARRDGDGFIWWGDGFQGRFGRLNPTSGQANWWTAPGSNGLFGSQLNDGDFWSMSWDESYLFGFEPDASRLCTYTLPLDGMASYPQFNGGSIWLGDENNDVLLSLDPQSAQFTSWPLPDNSMPLGLAFDQAGALWYADTNNAYLARFQESSGKPAHAILLFDLARGIELVYALERAMEILAQPLDNEDTDIPYTPCDGEVYGLVEAPRGPLIHHYRIENGLIAQAEFIIPTVHNVLAIEQALRVAADRHINAERVDMEL
jgi:hypothetical protein